MPGAGVGRVVGDLSVDEDGAGHAAPRPTQIYDLFARKHANEGT